MSIIFVKDGNICHFGETTNAISSPSPPFKIIYNPEGPISIGPTELKYVEVEIVPTANLFSNVTLHIGELPDGIENATFIETNSGIITSPNTTKTLEITRMDRIPHN